MVNTLKIPFMCAEGVGRLRCVEIFLIRARYSALALVCGTWGNRVARLAHRQRQEHGVKRFADAVEARIQVHGKRLTVPETA
jgi:hypothetical protein